MFKFKTKEDMLSCEIEKQMFFLSFFLFSFNFHPPFFFILPFFWDRFKAWVS